MRLKRLLFILVCMILSVPAMKAVVGDAVYVKVHDSRIVSSTMSGVTVSMESTESGVYKAQVTLSPSSGYYFCIYNKTQYKVYGPDTKGDEMELTGNYDGPIIDSDWGRGYCWYYPNMDDSDIVIDVTVNFNNMTCSIVKVSGGEITPPVPTPSKLSVRTATSRAVSKLNLPDKPMTTTGNGIFTYTLVLDETTGYYFCLFNNDKYCPVGPGTTEEVPLNLALNESFTGPIANNTEWNNGDCWYWEPLYDEVTLQITVNWPQQKVTIENIGKQIPAEPDEDYDITLDFSADNFIMSGHMMNYARVYDMVAEKEIVYDVNPLKVHLSTDPAGLSITAMDGYEFNIECTNWTGSGTPPFQITEASPMLQGDDVIEYGKQAILSLQPGADGLNFNVVLKRVAQPDLPNELYVMIGATGITLNQQLKPSDNDPYLTFNPETQCYEGTLIMGKKRFKFYVPQDNGNYKVLGQNGIEAEGTINFNRQLAPFRGECAWDADNCWYLGYTFANLTEMGVKMVVNPIENTVTYYPVLPETPDQLYIWGSTTGFYNKELSSVVGSVKRVEGTNIYKGTVNVPYVGEGTYTDPDTGVELPVRGWAFALGYYNNHCNSGLFNAQEGTNFIDFTQVSKYTVPMIGELPVNTLHTGDMDLEFNWETLELTATDPNGKTTYGITLDFVGEGENVDVNAQSIGKYMGVVNALVDEGTLTINSIPYNFYYSGDVAMLVMGAYEGYEIAVECTNWTGDPENAPFEISGVGVMDMDDELLDFGNQWQLVLKPQADGLNFLVTIKSTGLSAVETIAPEIEGIEVFNLQGVRVLKSDNASDLNLLPRGLYIVNGKKLILN